MRNNKTAIGLAFAILFQFLILLGEYVGAALPLWMGQEIKIKTIPVDPRSMFRGNYAQLHYDISEIKVDRFPEHEDLRNGEVVYVHLKPTANGLYEMEGVSLELPQEGIFLRGRIANRRYEQETDYFRIKYGIEAFFAPKEKAIELEKKLMDGGVAVLMVAQDGKAALKEVLSNIAFAM